MTAEDAAAPTAKVPYALSHSFNGQDSITINHKGDWRTADNAGGSMQSPVFQEQKSVFENGMVRDSNGPRFEAWIQRDRVSSTTEPTPTQRNNKSYRRPYSSARRTEDPKIAQPLSDNGDRSANLRSILKQTGGISLSEILQQKNLSLDDLLKGKQNAIKALQNTAAPPLDSRENTSNEKSMRRLPSLTQSNARRGSANVLFRSTSPSKIDSNEEIQNSTGEENNESVDLLSAEKKSVSTIPTFLADTFATTKFGRIPPSRKPIKEVVSAIRPDLNNSNIRKRLPSLKSLKQISTTDSQINDNIPPPTENTHPTNETVKDSVESLIAATEDEQMSKAMAITITTTTDEPKPTIRERVPFRPMRPRNGLQKSFHITEAPAPSADPLTTKVAVSHEEVPMYTVISSTTQTNEEYNIVAQPNENENRQIDDLNAKLYNDPAPEMNLVDLEDVSKMKEVTSLEDLFLDDEHIDDSSNSAESGSEFIHASSTSRSDTVPNSLKIFGSNLVNIFKKTLDKLDVTERNPALFTDITSRFIDDKTEIMDLLSDRRSGARLVKVLKQRNMTIDELIDHRKRGSSQLHLAEIFFNRTKYQPSSEIPPFPSYVNQTKLDVVTAFKNFPDFNLESVKSVNPDEIKTDSQGESYFTSIISIQPTAEITKEGRAIHKPFSVKLLESANKTNVPAQLWNTDSSVDTNFLENSSPGIASKHSLRPSTGDDVNANGFHEIIEQDRNDAAARYRDPLDLELTGHGYRRNSVLIENAQQTPMGVRSAIVASASIVLISLTIFIVIFLVCRWRQKRKRKICYTDRFQAIRGRLPILGSRDASPSKHSSSPPMAYIGGANNSRRSSKLNTMDPNSPEVQEYLYDAMRKPFQ